MTLTAPLVGCGGGSPAPPYDFVIAESGIRKILKNGVNLSEETGGYYIIGSCDGSDTAEGNVSSLGSDGHTLFAPNPACPGAPFQIDVDRIAMNAVRTSVTIGPLPVDYATLSVPLDVRSHHLLSYSTGTRRHVVGGCGHVEHRSGGSGDFALIPTPCPGGVGLAQTPGTVPAAAVHGESVQITRTIRGGDHSVVQFFRNLPIDTENIEVSFGRVARGRTVRLVEEIHVE